MSNQVVITSGAKVRNLEGVLTGTSGIMGSVPLGAANGVATLDSGGKVPVSQLPSSVVTYLGTWNAATNTPTLANGTGDAGDMYICNVAGTVNFGAGPITFSVGDWVLYGSGTWQKSNGQNGTVTSVAASITGNAIGITGSPITTAGTLALAFAGTSGQYINGAGNLVTFPTIVTEAQRLVTEVYNETGATLTKGTVVYINGGHGNLPTVTKAIATGDSTSAQTYGVVQSDITNMNNGYVVVIGSLTDLDTQSYAVGTQLYLSSTTAGAWTSTKQYAPAHLVYVGIVVRSHPTQGVVEVRIQNGFELDELHNVSAQTPSNNDGIFYNSTTSLWESKSIAAALGYTPANNSLVVHLAGTETITGTKTFSSTTLFDLATLFKKVGSPYITESGYTSLQFTASGTNTSLYITDGDSVTSNRLIFKNNAGYNYTFPATSGTISLTSDLAGYVDLTTAQTIGGTKTFSDATKNNGGILLQNGSSSTLAGYMNLGGLTNGVKLTSGGGISNTFTLPSATGYTFTFPNATGTVALTSDISYPVTSVFGRTGAVVAAEGDYSLTQLSDVIITTPTTGQVLKYNGTSWVNGTDTDTGITSLNGLTALTQTFAVGTSGTDFNISSVTSTHTFNLPTANATNRGALSSADWSTFNGKQGAITLTTTGSSGAATFVGNTLNIPNYGSALSGYVPYTGATATLDLGTKSLNAAYASLSGDGTNTTTLNLTHTAVGGTSGGNAISISKSGNGDAISITRASGTGYALSANSGIYATSFVKQTGTSSQFLKADGSVDSSTYLTTSSASSTYLPLAGGTLTGALIGTSATFSGTMAVGGTNISYAATGRGNITINGTSGIVGFNNSGTAMGYFFHDGTNMQMWNEKNGELIFGTNALTKMRIDASGNLGLGVTPSATSSGIKSFELQGAGAGLVAFGSFDLVTTAGAYYSSTGWKYAASGTATSIYYQQEGAHKFFTAPSGTAGNAISFTQAMTLTAAGSLGLGIATPSTLLHIASSSASFFTIDAGTSSNSGISFYRAGSPFGAIYYLSTNTMRFDVNNAIAMLIDSNANTSIGYTTNPSLYKLDVNGTGRFSGALTILNPSNTNTLDVTSGTSANGIRLRTRVDNDYSFFNWSSNNASELLAEQYLQRTAANTAIMRYTIANGSASPATYLTIASTGAASFSNNVQALNLIARANVTNPPSSGVTNGVCIGFDGNLEWGWIQSVRNNTSELRDLFIQPLGGRTAFGASQTIIFTNAGAGTFNSSVTATGFFESSSIKGKDIIATNPLLALDIDVIKYTRKSDESKDIRYGYSAEQIHSLMPELTDKDVTAVKYLDVHTILIAQLQKEIKELKAKMN